MGLPNDGFCGFGYFLLGLFLFFGGIGTGYAWGYRPEPLELVQVICMDNCGPCELLKKRLHDHHITTIVTDTYTEPVTKDGLFPACVYVTKSGKLVWDKGERVTNNNYFVTTRTLPVVQYHPQ